jgi:hypothetical protein
MILRSLSPMATLTEIGTEMMGISAIVIVDPGSDPDLVGTLRKYVGYMNEIQRLRERERDKERKRKSVNLLPSILLILLKR